MSSNFNNAKIINVYYTKGDRKPYDVNGKPIAYIGEEYIGANEATELRFHFGEELDSASAIIVAKRANGDTRLDPLELVGTGVNSYFKVRLNAWYAEYKGKMTIIFKVYNGTVTYDDPETPTQIVSTTGQIIVSDIFNLEVAYAPNASSLVPPFETEDYDDWFFTLSTKLDKAQSITVVGALPTLTGGVYDDRYFYVEDEGVGRLYYINGSTAIEVVWQVGTLRLTPTGNGEVTADTGKLSWNQPNGTINVGLYNNVTLGLGEDVFYYGKASGAIVKGDIVQFAGTQGDHFLIKKAVPAEINANPKLIMGVAKQDMDNNEFGYVAHFGKIEGVDTKGFAVGSFVWFSSGSINNGEWTTTQPTAPNAKILVAVIVKAETSENANNGVLLVRPTIEPSLKELQDVNVVSIANNQILRWNNSTLRWENTSALTTAEANITDLQGRMTTEEANVDNLQGRMTTAESNIINIEDGTTAVGRAIADENGDDIPSTYLKQVNASATYIPLSQKGANNGVVPLNSNGKISSQYLSGEQDDFIEFPTLEDFPETGEADIIYCAVDTGLIYRWTGSTYAVISPSLALGTTATTAFPGDRGLALETLTDNIVDGDQALALKDQVIRNTAVGTNPLIVNGIASTTTNLQEWQVNGSNVARLSNNGYLWGIGLVNLASSGNAIVDVVSTGTLITRNVNDTNPALKVNKNQGTGNILELRSANANKLEVDVNGFLYQNGTRLFTQPAGITNTFFGNTSGGTATTGINNTGFGEGALKVLTSGQANIAVGKNALASLTTSNESIAIGVSAGSAVGIGSQNTVVGTYGLGITTGSSNTAFGYGTGLTITSGSNNTFVGHSSGNNASQLATATNSTAIGNSSFTDKSNQMVFGNASVTEFKFDRNASAEILLPRILAGSSSIHNIRRTSSLTNESRTPLTIRHSTSGDMIDGFGSSLTFSIQDNSIVENIIGAVGVIRSGADNSGRLYFETTNAGSSTEKMTILPNGNVGIGTNNPTAKLTIDGEFDSKAIEIKRTGSLTGNASLRLVGTDTNEALGFSINATERMRITNAGNVGIGTSSPASRLEVLNSRTTEYSSSTVVENFLKVYNYHNNGGTNQQATIALAVSSNNGTHNGIIQLSAVAPTSGVSTADFVVQTRNGGTTAESLRILGNGLVGINETSPSAQLQVKSGATTRVPLIVDIVASSTANLQEWKKNGAITSWISNFGWFVSSSGIHNSDSSLNALVGTPSTGTTISRNIADTNPALIVNLANASATGNIQVWQKAGSAVANITGSGRLRVNDGISNNVSNADTLIFGGTTSTDGSYLQLYGNTRSGREGAGEIIVRENANSFFKLVSYNGVSTWTTRLQMNPNNGNIGIGTTNPNYKFEVDGIARIDGTPSEQQTGDYTLVLADKGKVVRINSSSNLTVTIPLNSSVAFPIDTEIAILRYGTGTVSISPTSGVTLNSKNSERKISGQYGSVALKKIGTDEWVLVGSLEA